MPGDTGTFASASSFFVSSSEPPLRKGSGIRAQGTDHFVACARNRPSDEPSRSAIIVAKTRAYRNAQCAAANPSVTSTAPFVKFHLSQAEGNVVTGSGPGWVRVGPDEHRENLVIAPDAIVKPWATGGFDALSEDDFVRVKSLEPEIVLLGTGARQRFPHPRLYRMLTDAGIGVEVMDSAAAARTYNIIAAEGRRVAAALLLP